MKEQILPIIMMLHVGGLLDGIIKESMSEEGLSKDKLVKLVQENVEIKELISACFKLGVNALKEKAENDGKTDYLDALVPIVSLTSEMIADAIGSYIEKLLDDEKEETAE